MASMSLKGLHKYFGSVHAVDDVQLDVRDGEFISLLGPSGCGKTTTLRMIAGLEVADKGAIEIADRDVTRLPPRDRNVAMVFQDYALYPHMTVLENVGYPLRVRGVSKDEILRRVSDVAGRLQIGALLERRPGQLSGGQQQRVALARAVVHQGAITLYDEPLSNLDTKLRLEARAFLKHLQNEFGLTSIYVTHDQAEAMALSDRIVVMNQGKVMQVGSPMDIYRRPANTFVASFIGSPPMNLIPCKVDTAANAILINGETTVPFSHLKTPPNAAHGAEISLGVRPEHILIHNQPPQGAAAPVLPARPYVMQELGSETLAVVYSGEHLVAVRLTGDETPRLPEKVWLELHAERLFFYDHQGTLIA